MARGDLKRVRVAVRHKGKPIGYLTTTSYPDRDISMFTEGSPYFEVVVANLDEEHVALFQRFKEHWLVHCGTAYTTTEKAGALNEKQILKLAVFALLLRDRAERVRVAALKEQVERML